MKLSSPFVPSSSADDLLSEDQVARLLNVSTRTLQGWRWRGSGPLFVRISRRAVRYRRRDLDEWIEERLARSTSDITNADRAPSELDR